MCLWEMRSPGCVLGIAATTESAEIVNVRAEEELYVILSLQRQAVHFLGINR